MMEDQSIEQLNSQFRILFTLLKTGSTRLTPPGLMVNVGFDLHKARLSEIHTFAKV
jgi:hypothetical protein